MQASKKDVSLYHDHEDDGATAYMLLVLSSIW